METKKPKPKKSKKKEPKKKKNKSGIIVEKDNKVSEQALDLKYSDKINSLVNKIKNQNESKPDVKIRFGWKY